MELINRIITAVCCELRVQQPTLWSSNCERCVDARFAIVHKLSEFMTDNEIASAVGVTRQSVNKLRNMFPYRRNKWNIKQAMYACNNIAT